MSEVKWEYLSVFSLCLVSMCFSDGQVSSYKCIGNLLVVVKNDNVRLLGSDTELRGD